MSTDEQEGPTIDIVLPQNGDAILLLMNSQMFESEDGQLIPGAYIDKVMAAETANVLMSWAVGSLQVPEDSE